MALFSMPKFSADDMNDARQMRRLVSYLYKLNEQLQYVLGNLDGDNMSAAFTAVIDSKAEAETVNELTGNLRKLSTQIIQTAEKIELKANMDEVNALGNGVTEAEASLKVQAEQISSRVTKTEFDALGNRVNGAESTITQQADQIAAKVTKTEFDALGKKVADNTSLIEQKADEITLQVESKLDAGDNAAGVDTGNEGVQVKITKDFFDVNVDGDNQLHVSEEGVSADSIVAPNVAAVYDGPIQINVNPTASDAQIEAGEGSVVRSLQQALDRINDKRLNYTVTVQMNRVNHFENIEIRGVTGSGMLVILANSARIYGSIRMVQCSAQVQMLGNATVYSGSQDALTADACAFVSVNGLSASGSGENGLLATNGSRIFLWNGDVNGYANALSASFGAAICADSCKGDGKVMALLGGVCALSTSMPSGGVDEQMNGQVWADGVGSASGSGETAPMTPTTASYTAITTATGRNTGGTWKSGMLRANFAVGYGVCKGCIWFDNTALRSALSGRTILSASLRLTRISGVGRSHGVQVTLLGLTLSGPSGALSNSTGAAVYGGMSAALGEISNGETVTFSVPPEFIRALAAGTINGLCLYGGETTEYNNRGYSRNYGGFAALGERTDGDPVLTVMYQ